MKLEDLTDLERRFIEAVAAGEVFHVDETLPQDQWLPPDEDSGARDIRATVIEALIDGKFGKDPITRHGLVLMGARITGALNLRNITFPYRLGFTYCQFSQSLFLDRATLLELSLLGSQLNKGLNAEHITTSNNFILGNLQAKGTVDLRSAKIGGQIVCTGAKLDGEDAYALFGQDMAVRGGVFLSGIQSKGTIDLNGSKIDGQLECTDAVLDGNGKGAFNGQRLIANSSIFLRGLQSKGTIDLNGSKIDGQLDCEGAVLNGNGKMALNGQNLTAKDSIILRHLRATGTVELNGSQIDGQLECTDAVLDGNGIMALSGHFLTINGGVFLRNLHATGMVNLTSAKINGHLDVSNAVLNCTTDFALVLQHATISALILRVSGESHGRISIAVAKLGAFDVGYDSWPDLVTIFAPNMKVSSLPEYKTSSREGWLSWIEKVLEWSPHLYQEMGAVLKEAGHEDCAKAFYIAMRRRTRKEEHLLFLDRLRNNRRDTILNEYICNRLPEGIRRFVDTALEKTVGYGYKPGQALVWMSGLVLLGTVIFYAAECYLSISPNKPLVMLELQKTYDAEGYRQCAYRYPDRSSSWFDVRTETEKNCLPADYPSFIPLLYSLDLAIPLLEMRPEQYWSVNGSAPGGWLFTLYYYFHLTMGIVLTGLFLAAVTGLVKKE